jgi:hypothetical protein
MRGRLERILKPADQLTYLLRNVKVRVELCCGIRFRYQRVRRQYLEDSSLEL